MLSLNQLTILSKKRCPPLMQLISLFTSSLLIWGLISFMRARNLFFRSVMSLASSQPRRLRLSSMLKFLRIISCVRIQMLYWMESPNFLIQLRQWLNSPLKMGCSRTQSQPILSFSSYTRHLLMNCLDGSDTQLLKLSYDCFSSSCKSVQLSDLQGTRPYRIQQNTTPNDQMSLLSLYNLAQRICGDMYMGVPTRVKSKFLLQASVYLDRPKSAILNFLLWQRMFSGLRSRCMMPFLTRREKPMTRCLRTEMAVFSSKRPFQISFLRRSLSQNSCMMQQLLLVSKQALKLTMNSLFLRFLRMLISLSTDRERNLSSNRFWMSMRLTTSGSSGESMRQPLQTFPQLPLPSSLSQKQQQFQILFNSLIITSKNSSQQLLHHWSLLSLPTLPHLLQHLLHLPLAPLQLAPQFGRRLSRLAVTPQVEEAFRSQEVQGEGEVDIASNVGLLFGAAKFRLEQIQVQLVDLSPAETNVDSETLLQPEGELEGVEVALCGHSPLQGLDQFSSERRIAFCSHVNILDLVYQ